jgi:hypothetical protein
VVIEEVQQGVNKPNRINVGQLVGVKKDPSRRSKSEHLEIPEKDAIKTDNIKDDDEIIYTKAPYTRFSK